MGFITCDNFFSYLLIFFWSISLKKRDCTKIVLIPKNIKIFFSEELDLGNEADRFGDRQGLKIYKKDSNLYDQKDFLLLSRYSGEKKDLLLN